MWQGVKKIITTKTNNTRVPLKIKVNGVQLEDSKQTVANIGKNLGNLIPKGNNLPVDYLSYRNPESFFLSPTSCDEIKNIIFKLKSNKSTGVFSIPTYILKMIN